MGDASRISKSSAVTVVVPPTNTNITESRNVAIFRPSELSKFSPSLELNKPKDGSPCEDYITSLSVFGGNALAQLAMIEATIKRTPKYNLEDFTKIKEKFEKEISSIIVDLKNSDPASCQEKFKQYVATLPKNTKGGKRNTRRRKSMRRKTQRRR